MPTDRGKAIVASEPDALEKSQENKKQVQMPLQRSPSFLDSSERSQPRLPFPIPSAVPLGCFSIVNNSIFKSLVFHRKPLQIS